MPIAMPLHLLAAVLWVGGMFFAWMVLRPEAACRLEPPARLSLWNGCFKRFFPWVWTAVILLPLSGYWMIFNMFGGMKHAGIYVHVMNGLGLLMIALFLFLFFGPYRRLRSAVAIQDWSEGGGALALIRRIVGTNLMLGLTTIVIAATGRWL